MLVCFQILSLPTTSSVYIFEMIEELPLLIRICYWFLRSSFWPLPSVGGCRTSEPTCQLSPVTAAPVTAAAAVACVAKLLEQTNFTEHPKMKAIMARVSDQRYSDVKGFVDDITKWVEIRKNHARISISSSCLLYILDT